jgi:hypothetical protein
MELFKGTEELEGKIELKAKTFFQHQKKKQPLCQRAIKRNNLANIFEG